MIPYDGSHRNLHGIDPDHVDWCRQHFAMLSEGGRWAIPRNGLVFEKHGNELVLIAKMSYQSGMPGKASDLARYQEQELELTRRNFAAAGIIVRDATTSSTRH